MSALLYFANVYQLTICFSFFQSSANYQLINSNFLLLRFHQLEKLI